MVNSFIRNFSKKMIFFRAPGLSLAIESNGTGKEPRGQYSKTIIRGSFAFIALVSLCYALAGCGASVTAGKGIGDSTGTFTASPDTVDFGSVSVGSSADNTVSLANSSTTAVVVSKLALSGDSTFSLVGQNQLPMTLTPGSTTVLKVHYDPTSASDNTGSLTITSNSMTIPTASVHFHGKGSNGSSSTSLSSISCTNTTITGAGTDSCSVTLSNAAPSGGFSVALASNNAAVKVPSTVSVPANASSATFSTTVAAVSTAQAATITASAAGTTKNIALQLSPSLGSGAPGTLAGLTCTSNSMTGAGSDACTISLSGAAPTGGVSVSLASNNAAVKVPSTVSVPANASSATFSATVAAVSTAQTATLTASSNGVSKTFALQLSASSSTTLSINATGISFGNVVLNAASTQSLQLTATGSQPVTVSAASVTGAGFALTGTSLPMTVNPGKPATLSVQFDPTAAGAATGKLTLVDNSTNNPNAAISLTGTGINHQVALTWDAPGSSSDPVSGYNVYRASGGSSTYTKLNGSANGQTSYSDTTAQSGTTYQYYVTSVDSSGTESTPSNTATVAVP